MSDFKTVDEDFREECWPAGPDCLTFKRCEHSPGSDETWRARWEGRSGYDKDYYTVYQWKTGFAYSRPDHPVLGECTGWMPSRNEAMRACAEDFEKVARLTRWTEHMTNHEPPGEDL